MTFVKEAEWMSALLATQENSVICQIRSKIVAQPVPGTQQQPQQNQQVSTGFGNMNQQLPAAPANTVASPLQQPFQQQPQGQNEQNQLAMNNLSSSSFNLPPQPVGQFPEKAQVATAITKPPSKHIELYAFIAAPIIKEQIMNIIQVFPDLELSNDNKKIIQKLKRISSLDNFDANFAPLKELLRSCNDDEKVLQINRYCLETYFENAKNLLDDPQSLQSKFQFLQKIIKDIDQLEKQQQQVSIVNYLFPYAFVLCPVAIGCNTSKRGNYIASFTVLFLIAISAVNKLQIKQLMLDIYSSQKYCLEEMEKRSKEEFYDQIDQIIEFIKGVQQFCVNDVKFNNRKEYREIFNANPYGDGGIMEYLLRLVEKSEKDDYAYIVDLIKETFQ